MFFFNSCFIFFVIFLFLFNSYFIFFVIFLILLDFYFISFVIFLFLFVPSAKLLSGVKPLSPVLSSNFITCFALPVIRFYVVVVVFLFF